MKRVLLAGFTLLALGTNAQKVEKIFVNLYTDSLKKGTYNYINIDGQLANGQYMPLDSTHLIFWASAGKFSGNSLWLDPNFQQEKVDFKVTLRSNPSLYKEFTVYIKKKPDPPLKTLEEIMNEPKPKSGKAKNG